MLTNSTLRAPFVKAARRSTSTVPPEALNRASLATQDAPVVPFARLPHALVGDHRLDSTARLIGAALLFWARDRPMATMSNASLARLLGLSLSVIERGLRALKRLGYILTEAVKASPANLTGRVVHLRWVEDPAILPPAPDRRALEAGLGVAAAPEQGGDVPEAVPTLSQETGPLRPERGGGSVAGDGGRPSPATDKEDRPREKLENSENGREDDLPGRRRPQAGVSARSGKTLLRGTPPTAETAGAVDEGDHYTSPNGLRLSAAKNGGASMKSFSSDPAKAMSTHQTSALATGSLASPTATTVVPAAQPPAPAESPLARTLDRAMVDARQAASRLHDDEKMVAGNTDGQGELLTAGQRQALEAMTPNQRAAFERKAPGLRAQILEPFVRAFDRDLFDRVTRSLLIVPRFVAEAQPVERTTPGLVAAVAGGDPRFVAELAESLCRDLGGAGDRRRWGALHALAKQVLDRVVPAEDVLDAYRQGMGPRALSRGAVFTTALRRLGWRPEDRPEPVRLGFGG